MPKTDTQTVARLLREYAQRTALRGGNASISKGRVAAVTCDCEQKDGSLNHAHGRGPK
jgi:hypothetical protein